MFFTFWFFVFIHQIFAQSVTDTPSPTATVLTPTQTTVPPTPTTPPISNVTFNEVSAYSEPEWIEIYNGNSTPVTLTNWKIKDLAGNTKSIPTVTIQPNALYSFSLGASSILNNSVSATEPEKIFLLDDSDRQIDSYQYTSLKADASYSWSYTTSGWCQKISTPAADNGSCPVPTTSSTLTPTQTPVPSNSPSPVTPSSTRTPTPTTRPSSPTPIEIEATPTDFPEPTPEVLGTTDSLSPTTYIYDPTPTPTTTPAPIKTKFSLPTPVIFLVAGGIILLVPMLFSLLQKNR